MSKERIANIIAIIALVISIIAMGISIVTWFFDYQQNDNHVDYKNRLQMQELYYELNDGYISEEVQYNDDFNDWLIKSQKMLGEKEKFILSVSSSETLYYYYNLLEYIKMIELQLNTMKREAEAEFEHQNISDETKNDWIDKRFKTRIIDDLLYSGYNGTVRDKLDILYQYFMAGLYKDYEGEEYKIDIVPNLLVTLKDDLANISDSFLKKYSYTFIDMMHYENRFNHQLYKSIINIEDNDDEQSNDYNSWNRVNDLTIYSRIGRYNNESYAI